MSLVERACELARSGNCRSVSDVQRELRRERFDFSDIEITLAGSATRKMLNALCKEHWSPAATGDAAAATASGRQQP